MRLLTETKDLKIEGVSFTIGIIDRRKFYPIKMRFLAQTRFLSDLSKEELRGLTPAEIGKKATQGFTPIQIQEMRELVFSAQWDMVKYGLRAQSGFLDSEGKEILLVKDDGGCVADQTIDLYELNGLLSPLANEIFIFNTATEEEKKN